MALAGPPSGNGGRLNSTEAFAVEQRRLDDTARERCIRQRLARVPSAHLATLRVAYGADDWTACHSAVEGRGNTNPLTAPQVFRAVHARLPAELLRLAPYTAFAIAYERRHALSPHRSSVPSLTPKPAEKRPADPDTTDARAAVRALLARDPLLARTARGAVLLAACGVCPACAGPSCSALETLTQQAAALLQAAHVAACIERPERYRQRRVRVSRTRSEVRPHAA